MNASKSQHAFGIKLLLPAAFAALWFPVLAQQAVPEIPAIWREVTGITAWNGTSATHTRPHVPSFRTSTDGRVALRVKGSYPTFALMMPEKLSTPTSNPVLLSPPGDFTMSSLTFRYLDTYNNDPNPPADSVSHFYTGITPGPTDTISHMCLYDPTGPSGPTSNNNTNPSASGSNDVYNLKVFLIYTFNDANGNSIATQHFVTPVTVTVSNPKTTSAAITSIVIAGPTAAGIKFDGLNGRPLITDGKEPNIVGDGRLLVMRVGNQTHSWNDPNNPGNTYNTSANIVYSYYKDTDTNNGGDGTPCNGKQWDNLIPITYANRDTRINTLFGFAMAPFRDPKGVVITPTSPQTTQDLGGTYPWIDRQARNLFFTAVADTLQDGSLSRYPQTDLSGNQTSYNDESSNTRGVCFAGLWSHGKIVLIDNMNSDIDYGLGNDPNDHRLVNLFQPGGTPRNQQHGWIELGAGRENSGHMPPGDNTNTTIMDSLQNIFNYRTEAFPLAIRDVVWPFSNTKQTDEVVFDDFVDADAFIVSTMAGLLTYDTTHYELDYHSGYNSTSHSFTTPSTSQLQNAATATPDRWTVPVQGNILGNGRLEPAATGGVHGKGFWMDGSSIGLQFPVVAQPAGVNFFDHDWFISLFVDARFNDDSTERLLLSFPDQSTVSLLGRHQLVYKNTSGTVVNRITLPMPLQGPPGTPGWSHLGFQVRKTGTQVDLFLDGFLFNHWQDPSTKLFQMAVGGNMTIGQPNPPVTNAFRGWIDEFLVLAHAVDFETACNHAGGTLVGLSSSYPPTGEWKILADSYPDWAHQAVTDWLTNHGQGASTYTRYASFHDYTRDNGVYRNDLDAGLVSLRQKVHFPEGPFFRDQPRPYSNNNPFCMICHVGATRGANLSDGLHLDALTLSPGSTATNDLRRQPMQPFRKLFGNIPALLVTNTTRTVPSSPGYPISFTPLTDPKGQVIDLWSLPAFGDTPYNGATAVSSFTLVNTATGEDVMTLAEGAAVEPAQVGTTDLTIRANLLYGQGGMTLKLDSTSGGPLTEPPFSYHVGSVTGAHSLTATPTAAPVAIRNFSVLNGTSRLVAKYSTSFRPFSPLPGWSYQWNEGSILSNLNWSSLYWNPAASRYDYSPNPGFFGGGGFTATGGAPGNGTSTPGNTTDRYAITTYTVKLAGNYAIGSSSATVSASGGVTLKVFTLTGATPVYTQKSTKNFSGTWTFDISLGALQAGDRIGVAIGPNGNDANDTFSNFDFSILFN